MKINSITDAQTVFENSGVFNWEFGANVDRDKIPAFLRQHWDNDADCQPQFDNLIKQFLQQCGENLNDYDF